MIWWPNQSYFGRNSTQRHVNEEKHEEMDSNTDTTIDTNSEETPETNKVVAKEMTTEETKDSKALEMEQDNDMNLVVSTTE